MNIKLVERRKYHRIDFDGQVDLNFTADSYECYQAQNINLTGIFVTGAFQKQQAGKCFVNLFNRTESEEIYLKATARVVWGNPEGLGLRFTSMAFESYMSLLTTLINNAEQPVIILREFPKICPFEIKSEE